MIKQSQLVLGSLLVSLVTVECGGEVVPIEETEGRELTAQASHCEGWNSAKFQWCLTTCTGSGSTLWVVGTEIQVGGNGKCNEAAEWWCAWNGKGHRASACWGNWR